MYPDLGHRPVHLVAARLASSFKVPAIDCTRTTASQRRCKGRGGPPALTLRSIAMCRAAAAGEARAAQQGGGRDQHNGSRGAGSQRRELLALATALVGSLELAASPTMSRANALPLPNTGPENVKFRKTASGVKIQDLLDGDGPEAKAGDFVVFNYVCRRANGYYVYSSVDQFSEDAQPVVLPLGQGKMIVGLEELLLGMRPGAKRRALVPPEAGYTSRDLQPQPTEFGPQRALFAHAKEPLFFEVQLLKIK